MGNLAQIEDVALHLGTEQLFTDLNLSVSDDTKLAIVGANGSGKSSLLRLLMKEIEPDSGRVIHAPSVRIGYVPQQEKFVPGESVLEAGIRKLSYIGDEHTQRILAAKVLTKAGFESHSVLADELSGGWRKRLSLATAMANDPQLLVLDEPTNHLDLSGLHWLEELLKTSRFPWVLVSHDRYFLEQVSKKILDLSRVYPRGYKTYEGSYLEFREKKKGYLEQENRRIASLANKARRELEWASRSPKARTGKASFRMKQAERLAAELREAKSQKEATQEVVEFQTGDKGSKELVQCIQVSFAFDSNEILKKFSFTVKNRNCIGLLGRNGDGKSTLLKLLGGALSPQSGKIKRIQGLRFAYFEQLRASLSEWNTLGELLGEGSDSVVYQDKSYHVIGWGRRFGFEPEDHSKAIDSLSGGEQARALLSMLVRQEADVLLLDEPTNDLDIPMLEALEGMILEFDGAVVLVTHDRYMLDEVCTHFLGFMGGGELKNFASFEQWNDAILEKEAKVKAQSRSGQSVVPGDEVPKKKPSKLTYNDQREYGKIEGQIEKAEAALSALEERAADPNEHQDPKKSAQLTSELAAAKDKVEKLYVRWEELDTLKRSFE